MKILDIISLCKPTRPSDLRNPVGAKVKINLDPAIWNQTTIGYFNQNYADRRGVIVAKVKEFNNGIIFYNVKFGSSTGGEAWSNKALEVIG